MHKNNNSRINFYLFLINSKINLKLELINHKTDADHQKSENAKCMLSGYKTRSN